jgi:hypothetical protein
MGTIDRNDAYTVTDSRKLLANASRRPRSL